MKQKKSAGSIPKEQQRRLYERFRLQWMIDHGYTLSNLIEQLETARKETDDDENLQSVFKMWELESGFYGEIWPCFDEFITCDYGEFIKCIEDESGCKQ